jgi:dsRNA-specific ribonuclease
MEQTSFPNSRTGPPSDTGAPSSLLLLFLVLLSARVIRYACAEPPRPSFVFPRGFSQHVPERVLHAVHLCRLATQFQIFEPHASLLNGVVREELALTALTTPGAEMEDEYEDLEYIGDAVLKYISTVYVCVRSCLPS